VTPGSKVVAREATNQEEPVSERSDATSEQHTSPEDQPEAGQPASGGKPDEAGKPGDKAEGGLEEKGPGTAKADATPAIGTDGEPGQTQVSGDPGEPPDEGK